MKIELKKDAKRLKDVAKATLRDKDKTKFERELALVSLRLVEAVEKSERVRQPKRKLGGGKNGKD